MADSLSLIPVQASNYPIAMNYHKLLLNYTSPEGPLLVPQCFYRVELRGLVGWEEAEEDAHRRCRAEGQQDGAGHNHCAHLTQRAEKLGTTHTRHHANQASH